MQIIANSWRQGRAAAYLARAAKRHWSENVYSHALALLPRQCRQVSTPVPSGSLPGSGGVRSIFHLCVVLGLLASLHFCPGASRVLKSSAKAVVPPVARGPRREPRCACGAMLCDCAVALPLPWARAVPTGAGPRGSVPARPRLTVLSPKPNRVAHARARPRGGITPRLRARCERCGERPASVAARERRAPPLRRRGESALGPAASGSAGRASVRITMGGWEWKSISSDGGQMQRVGNTLDKSYG